MTLQANFESWNEVIFVIPAFALTFAALASILSIIKMHQPVFAVYLLVVISIIVGLFLTILTSIRTIDGPGIFGAVFLFMGMIFLGPILLSIGLIGLIKGATKGVKYLSVSSLALSWLFLFYFVLQMLLN